MCSTPRTEPADPGGLERRFDREIIGYLGRVAPARLSASGELAGALPLDLCERGAGGLLPVGVLRGNSQVEIPPDRRDGSSVAGVFGCVASCVVLLLRSGDFLFPGRVIVGAKAYRRSAGVCARPSCQLCEPSRLSR
ncbi:MAG: hypothetical protein QOD87_2422 [Pseudonocardiales bacterium]|nr:hypothetical protein [Pseudonocardiales bacterium]